MHFAVTVLKYMYKFRGIYFQTSMHSQNMKKTPSIKLFFLIYNKKLNTGIAFVYYKSFYSILNSEHYLYSFPSYRRIMHDTRRIIKARRKMTLAMNHYFY